MDKNTFDMGQQGDKVKPVSSSNYVAIFNKIKILNSPSA
jgi:hypothetical protein